MDGIKRFLIAACIAGCGGGGGGGGSGTLDGGMTDASGDGNGSDPNIPAASNDRCASAASINLTTMHSDLQVNPGGSNADLAAPCGTAGTPDVFYKISLTTRELVYADTFGSTSNTALYFADSCSDALTASTMTGDTLCSSGACGTGQSQVVALLNPGVHYLVLAGHGATTIHFQHAESGVGDLAVLPQGTHTLTGTTTTGSGALFACEAGGMESTYWWTTCPTDLGGAIHATTCTGSSFDTILSLQLPGTENVACADDDNGCAAQTRSTLDASIPAGAGLNVIAVDGGSQVQHGAYTLTVTRP